MASNRFCNSRVSLLRLVVLLVSSLVPQAGGYSFDFDAFAVGFQMLHLIADAPIKRGGWIIRLKELSIYERPAIIRAESVS